MKKLLLSALLILSGCGGDDFRKIETLSGFRVLAIQADSPELAPGGTTALRVYVSDAGSASGRSVTAVTESCVDPGISFGAPLACDHDPNRIIGSYTVNTAAFGASNYFTGLEPSTVTVNIPANFLVPRSTRERFNGVGYLTIFRFSVDDGAEVVAFKTIKVTDRGSLNINPATPVISLNGAPIGRKSLKGEKLGVISDIPETYTFINIDGQSETRTENYEVAWYVSSGEVDMAKADIGDEVEYKSDPPEAALLIISIVRDERGGVAIKEAIY